MNLTTARTIVRNAARSGLDTDRYSLTQVDIAIARVGNDFVNRTGCAVSLDSIDVTAEDPAVAFTDLIAEGFHPRRLLEVRLDESDDYAATSITDNLALVSLREIRNCLAQRTAVGVPLKIGFIDDDEAEVWPTPSYDGTLSVWWKAPFTTWTLGVADGSAITLNIPEDLIWPVLDCAAVIMQLQDPEAQNAQLRSGFYEQHVQANQDAGSRGERAAMAEED